MNRNRNLKANSRGSWANVMSFDQAETERVQDACEALSLASGFRVSFKITDDKNVTLHALDIRHEPVGWSDR